MATVNQLLTAAAEKLGDPFMESVKLDSWLRCLNEAANDAKNADWLIKVDDATISYVADTFEYTVPATFAYILEVRTEDGGDLTVVPYSHWTLRDGDTPVIRFSEELYANTNVTLSVQGYKRPTVTYAAMTETVDLNLESFLRERTLSLAARLAAAVDQPRSNEIQALGSGAFRFSEQILEDRMALQETQHITDPRHSRSVWGR